MINKTIINNKQELGKLVNNIMQLTDTKTLDDIQGLAYTLKKFALERILEAEMEEHLGYDKNKKRLEGSDNYRNGTYPQIVKSSSGEISLDIPRDRKGEFTPQIVQKGSRSISNIEDKIIHLYAQGLSTRDVSETVKELYGVSVSSETVSNIINRINDSIKEWQSKPLQSLYPVIFMDGIVCKVRVDGADQNCTVYACIGIDSNGHKEVLRITLGRAESAKFWLKVINDLKARGIQDILIFCTDNLTGLTEAIKACYPNGNFDI